MREGGMQYAPSWNRARWVRVWLGVGGEGMEKKMSGGGGGVGVGWGGMG